MSKRTSCAFLALLLSVASLALVTSSAVADVVMTDVTATSFLAIGGAKTELVNHPRGFVLEDNSEWPNSFGPGIAWADLNGDGWLDLMVGNGNISNDGASTVGNYCLLNNGDGTFTDVSDGHAFWVSRVANGLALADINNDGYLDMAVGNFWKEPQLLIGYNGGFNQRGRQYGVDPLLYDASNPPPQPSPPESMGVSFGDYNQDGYVDLYIANYLRQKDILMESRNGGYFVHTGHVDQTRDGYGFMGVFWDFDNDDDLDIYVANDFGYNFLFENMGEGAGWTFVEKARPYRISGGADSGEPKSMGMGLAIADYDNDLDLDVYVTNYFLNALYENTGSIGGGTWSFGERANVAGVEFPLNCWGVDFVDLDLDRDLDLVMASGWIQAPVDPQPFDIPNKLWLNDGAPNWTFTDVSDASGFNHGGRGRALATGDYDRDGDIDVAITNATYHLPEVGGEIHLGHAMLYRNDQQEGGHFLVVKLEGDPDAAEPNSLSAPGARVYVTAGGLTQMREIQAGASFLSQNSLEAEFGLGDATTIDEVRVRWLGGVDEVFQGIEVDRFYKLVQGSGLGTALPVALSSFRAEPTGQGIRLEWNVAPGVQVVQSRLYRAPAGNPNLVPLPVVVDFNEGHGLAFDTKVIPGERYAYRLDLVGEDGAIVQSPVIEATAKTTTSSHRARLGQNFPNPFNPSTTILFTLPRTMDVRVVLFDLQGRQVRSLFEGPGQPGPNTLQWDGKDDTGRGVSSGTYIYRLETDQGSEARRMVLVR